MKTIKIMSIIGLVVAGLSLLVFFSFDTADIDEADAIAGWLMIVSVWTIAQSIVSIVQAKKKI